MKFILLSVLLLVLLGIGVTAFASGTAGGVSGQSPALTLLWIAVILLLAKGSRLVEKIGQPSVLGELIVGVILGNLALLGITVFEPIKANQFLPFLAELGVVILLFQVGLESNISQMKKVGVRAFLVATVGVVCPFVLGAYIIGPWVLPGLSNITYVFLGAALTATSVGITARVFKDLNILGTPEARIVLGAAVIDDVMGLMLLAIVAAIATTGIVSIGAISVIFLKAVSFLIGAMLAGKSLAPFLGRVLSQISPDVGMKFTLALSFALIFSYIAGGLGLAPIVGAFAAGLVLDPAHFMFFKKPNIVNELDEKFEKIRGYEKKELQKITRRYSDKHIENLIEPVAHFFVPIFFVITGMSVRLETLFNAKILMVAAAITLAAIAGKYVAGFFAGKVNKTIVGFGMVPRGEVGLIFASVGAGLGVINQQVFSVIVIVVMVTTLVTPPILAHVIKRGVKQM